MTSTTDVSGKIFDQRYGDVPFSRVWTPIYRAALLWPAAATQNIL